jgi:microcompartment protein CcmK/EutM
MLDAGLEEIRLVVHGERARGESPGGTAPRDEKVVGGVSVITTWWR